MGSIDEGGTGRGDGTATDPDVVDPFADGSLETPNCPACLSRMEAAETPAGAVYWSCPACGQTAVA